MHELALAQNLLKVVCQSAEENQLNRVTTVSVVCGELMGVVFDALEFGFQVSSSQTVAEDAKLELREIPALIKCSSCDHKYLWKTNGYFCPQCLHLGGEMIQGNEFYVDYIEGEEEGGKTHDSN